MRFCLTRRLSEPIWGMTMLEVRNLSVSYGQHRALDDVSVKVDKGEIVVILGANGAGKSTLLRAISGICEGQVRGQVDIDGHPIKGKSSDKIVEAGVALVPEGRGIFGDLSVRENLILGAYSKRAREDEAANLERVFSLFPKLAERQGQIARTMSGGEQQMVAIGRAMMSNPQVLMLDEPSLGLAPLLCKELFQNLTEVRKAGIGILLVEQNAKQSLAIADRGYLLENAHIVHEDTAQRLSRDPAVQKAYLGAGGQAVGKVAQKAAPSPVPADVPQFVPPVKSATPRRTADQQIGFSIDDMVQTATQVSRTAPRKPAADIAAAAQKLTNDRLSVVMRDIEEAARTARHRKPILPGRSTTSTSVLPTPSSEPEGPPPVIEVYRRPRVEVYRRRPSGQFERD